MVEKLNHRPEIQAALAQCKGDPVAAIGSMTKGDILRICYLADMDLEDVMGPVVFASEEERHAWEENAAANCAIIDTVSLGDALAMSQFPGHPDIMG